MCGSPELRSRENERILDHVRMDGVLSVWGFVQLADAGRISNAVSQSHHEATKVSITLPSSDRVLLSRFRNFSENAIIITTLYNSTHCISQLWRSVEPPNVRPHKLRGNGTSRGKSLSTLCNIFAKWFSHFKRLKLIILKHELNPFYQCVFELFTFLHSNR